MEEFRDLSWSPQVRAKGIWLERALHIFLHISCAAGNLNIIPLLGQQLQVPRGRLLVLLGISPNAKQKLGRRKLSHLKYRTSLSIKIYQKVLCWNIIWVDEELYTPAPHFSKTRSPASSISWWEQSQTRYLAPYNSPPFEACAWHNLDFCPLSCGG